MAIQERQDLVTKWIRPHPRRRGVEEARLVKPQISVWALVGHLRTVGWDVNRTAEAYRIPPEAVEAALAYYEQHRTEIDARLAANAV